MSSSNSQKLYLQDTLPYLLIEISVKLFAIGIFSTEGGAKSWFELTLITATLCACGYILWWQTLLLIIAVLLGTFAAGMLSVLAPRYIVLNQFTASKSFSASLEVVSKYNLNKVDGLTGKELIEYLEVINKARDIFLAHPDIVNKISDLQKVRTNIENGWNTTDQKIQREEFIRTNNQQQQEARRNRREEQEREQNKRQQKQEDAKRKRLNDQLRQRQEDASKPKDQQARSQADVEKSQKPIRQTDPKSHLNQEKSIRYNSGHPPYPHDLKQAPPGYPIKVTANLKKGEKYKGIYYKRDDPEYQKIEAHWWFESPYHAAQNGFRRPKDRSGRLRP